MKPVSDLIHRTPWWGLIAGGFALFVGLAVFVTPFNLIRLQHSGETPEQNRAIKQEIKATFSEGAIDIAHRIVREMRNRAKEPARREELDRALEDIEQARQSVREAGQDAQRARRKADEDVANAMKDAERAMEEARKGAVPPPPPPPKPDEPPTALAQASPPELPEIEVPPLPPEIRADIRHNLNRDLYRIGVGSGLILLFIPIFVLTLISKIFIDRSRAALKVAEAKRREADYHRMSRQVTEAKLAALQAQVEPHFLYNTLASVQALTEVDPQKANAMTGHLIQYLRSALPKMRESVSTVGQEVELVRAYLNILQMRMGKRLAFEIGVPPELLEAPFPPLMLPSLVENAIKHGLEPQREGGTVTITAQARDGKTRIAVADTGRGFSDMPGEGVGLANIRERLEALYGEQGRLTLEANEPSGVRATIEVPKERVLRDAPPAAPPPMPAAAKGAAARTFAAMGTVERAWRKGLSFTYVVLVGVAAVFAGLAMVGFVAGALHVHLGDQPVGGAAGALLGMTAMLLAFAVVAVVLAVVFGIVYGLGFVFAGLVVFIPLVILISLFPVLAPFVLVGLGLWWLVRRSAAKDAARASGATPPPAPPPAA